MFYSGPRRHVSVVVVVVDRVGPVWRVATVVGGGGGESAVQLVLSPRAARVTTVLKSTRAVARVLVPQCKGYARRDVRIFFRCFVFFFSFRFFVFFFFSFFLRSFRRRVLFIVSPSAVAPPRVLSSSSHPRSPGRTPPHNRKPEPG